MVEPKYQFPRTEPQQAQSRPRPDQARRARSASGAYRHQRRVRGEFHPKSDQKFWPGLRKTPRSEARHHHGVVHRLRAHRSMEQLRGNRVRHRGHFRAGPHDWLRGRPAHRSGDSIYRLHRRRAHHLRHRRGPCASRPHRTGPIYRRVTISDPQLHHSRSADGLYGQRSDSSAHRQRKQLIRAPGMLQVQRPREFHRLVSTDRRPVVGSLRRSGRS